MIKDLVVLAGGLGTRLRAITGDLPKPLAIVNGKLTVLDCILGMTFDWGIKNVYLSLNYKAELFDRWLQTRNWPFSVKLIAEPKPLGTGGALAYVVKEVGIKSAFVAFNGDTFVELNFKSMVKKFRESNKQALLCLSKVGDCGRYGRVVDNEMSVVEFREKEEGIGEGWINNGVYIFNPNVFDEFKGNFSLEKDLFPILCSKRQLGTFRCNGIFRDIGVPEDFELFRKKELNKLISINNLKRKIVI
jgi:D-glycero-alpha-D-manno-heptose 1-phosphate guanylyltransferase